MGDKLNCEGCGEYVGSRIADRIAALTAERDALAEQVKRARDDALEEAAKVADPALPQRKGRIGLWRQRRAEIATAIRALRGATEGAGG